MTYLVKLSEFCMYPQKYVTFNFTNIIVFQKSKFYLLRSCMSVSNPVSKICISQLQERQLKWFYKKHKFLTTQKILIHINFICLIKK